MPLIEYRSMLEGGIARRKEITNKEILEKIMTKAVRFHRTGGPEVLQVDDVQVGEPGVGQGVTHVKPGDRVGYAGGPPGAYSEVRLVPADRLVKVPSGISDKEVAAMMRKGLTVQYLIRRVYHVEKGETVLLHAAAGGVGLIACQWLKALGARVIGTVGSDEKAKIAKAHGCDHAIVSTLEDIAARVK